MSTQMTEPRIDLEQHLHMYRQMAKIRAFEEQVNELYKGAKMPGLAHLYVGGGGGRSRESARRSSGDATSPARTAATATASPRAPR